MQHDTVIRTAAGSVQYNKAAKSISFYGIDLVGIDSDTLQYIQEDILMKVNAIQQNRQKVGLDNNDVITDTNKKVKALLGNDFYINFDTSDNDISKAKNKQQNINLLCELRSENNKKSSKLVTVVKNYPMVEVQNIYQYKNIIIVTNNKDAYCLDYKKKQIRLYFDETWSYNKKTGSCDKKTGLYNKNIGSYSKENGTMTWNVDQVLPKLNELCEYIEARRMQEEEILLSIFGDYTLVFY